MGQTLDGPPCGHYCGGKGHKRAVGMDVAIQVITSENRKLEKHQLLRAFGDVGCEDSNPSPDHNPWDLDPPSWVDGSNKSWEQHLRSVFYR